jgi:O-antigen/teichoic acid export membrane protein
MSQVAHRRRDRVLGEATAFSDYVSVTAARGVYALLSLASVTITTRLLAPREFGALSLFFVISLLMVTAASAWTSAAVSRFGREELERTGAMTGVTAARVLFVAPVLVLSAALVLALRALGALPAAFSSTLAWLSVAYATVWVVFDHVVYLLETWGRQKLSAVALVVQQLAYVAALGVVYASGAKASPVGVALLVMSAMGLLAAAIGLRVRRVGFAARRAPAGQVRRMWRFSRPLIAFVASQYAMRSVDLLVLAHFSSVAAVGTYALAYQGYGTIQGLAVAAGPVFTPLLVSLRLAGREAVMRMFLERMVGKLQFLAASVAALAMAPAYALVPLVFGSRFASARVPLIILLGAAAVFFAACLLGSIVTVFDRTRETAIINLAAAALNIVSDLVLIGVLHCGLWAPALNTVLSVAVIWLGYHHVAARCLDSRTGPDLLWLAPVAVAPVPLLLASGALAVGLSLAGAAAAIAMVFVYSRLFRRGDVELLAALDMPHRVRAWSVRLLQLTRA